MELFDREQDDYSRMFRFLAQIAYEVYLTPYRAGMMKSQPARKFEDFLMKGPGGGRPRGPVIREDPPEDPGEREQWFREKTALSMAAWGAAFGGVEIS